jgi:hypothetical protein
MYALLARRPPFADVALHQVVHKLVNETPPPLRKLALGAPPELLDLVEQLLAKEPSERVATAHALSNRLRAAEFVAAARADEERQAASDREEKSPGGDDAEKTAKRSPASSAPSSSAPASSAPETRVRSHRDLNRPPPPASAESQGNESQGNELPDDDPSELLTPIDDGDQRTSLHDTRGAKPTGIGDGDSMAFELDEIRLAPPHDPYANYAPTSLSSPGSPSSGPPTPAGRRQVTAAWRNEQTVGGDRAGTDETRSRTSSRFTTVDEDVRRRAERGAENDGPPLWVKAVVGSVGLVVAGGAIAAGGFFALRPPSADSLYAKIEAAAESDDERALLSVIGPMAEFRRRYPEDPRIDAIAGWQEDLETFKLQRRFDLRSRRLHRQNDFSAVQTAYVQAMELAKTDTEAGIGKLEALLVLIGDGPYEEEATKEVAALAEKTLARLKDSQATLEAEQRAFIEERLATAERLAKSDRKKANRMLQSVIELYGDRSFANEQVVKARRRLSAGQPSEVRPSEGQPSEQQKDAQPVD